MSENKQRCHQKGASYSISGMGPRSVGKELDSCSTGALLIVYRGPNKELLLEKCCQRRVPETPA